MSNTKTSSSLKTLCRTAIFLALLIAVQFVTRSIGQYVTGSLVNLILIASGLMCGLWGGLAVAVLSPICAFFIGIGPAFPQVVPAVALGNAVLVLLWVLIAGAKNAPIARQAIALVVAAVAKFLTLYLVIVKWLVPMVLTLNEKQTAVLSASFSFPQLITAVIGGVLAMLLVPPCAVPLKFDIVFLHIIFFTRGLAMWRVLAMQGTAGPAGRLPGFFANRRLSLPFSHKVRYTMGRTP